MDINITKNLGCFVKTILCGYSTNKNEEIYAFYQLL